MAGSSNEGYRGHQAFWTSIRMRARLHLSTFTLVFAAHLLLALVLTTARNYDGMVEAGKAHLAAFGSEEARKKVAYFREYKDFVGGEFWRYAKYLSLVWLAYPLVIRFYRGAGRADAKKNVVRGAQFSGAEEVNREIARQREKTHLTIGEIGFPVSAEPKHALIVGRPGVGKTVLISEILSGIRRRGDRAVVYDFKGDFIPRFYDPRKDVIFSPVDKRCLQWSVFDECVTMADIDAVAASLVPQATTGDPFWNNGARAVLTGILRYLYQTNQRSNVDLWRALTLGGRALSDILGSTDGGQAGWRFIEDGENKQAAGVLAALMQYTQVFELMAGLKRGFTIRDWIDRGEGWIFVANYSEFADTLRPALSLFVDLVGRKLLGMPDDRDRRVFFVVDEFGTLQQLSTITRLLTLGRSKGGSVWLGIQDIGQIRKIYGEEHQQTICNSCGTSVTFSVADPDTGEYLSKRIGDAEFVEAEESIAMGGGGRENAGITVSRRYKTERLILPSQIRDLRDLEMYTQLPNAGVAKTKLTYKAYPSQAEAMVLREDMLLSVGRKQAGSGERVAQFLDKARNGATQLSR